MKDCCYLIASNNELNNRLVELNAITAKDSEIGLGFRVTYYFKGALRYEYFVVEDDKKAQSRYNEICYL